MMAAAITVRPGMMTAAVSAATMRGVSAAASVVFCVGCRWKCQQRQGERHTQPDF
jgi:hypothetical protein